MISAAKPDARTTGVLLVLLMSAIALGVLVSVVPDIPLFLAVLSAALLVVVNCVRIEIGLYVVVLVLPLQYLEMVFGGSIGVSLLDLALWPWILSAGIRMAVHQLKFQGSKLHIPILAWLIATLLSGLAARNLASWAVALVSQLIHCATIIVTFNELSLRPQVLKRVTDFYIVVGIAVALLGALQTTGVLPSQVVDPFSDKIVGSIEEGKMGGLLTNPNFMAAYLVMPMFLSWGKYMNLRGTRRTVCLILSLIFLLAIVLTLSRAGFFAIAAGTGVFFITRKRKLWKLILGILVAALLLVGLFAIYDEVYEDTSRSGAVVAALRGDISEADRSVRYRFGFARMAFDMFRSSPVIGIGAGQFQAEFWRFVVPGYEFEKAFNAHNTYLQVLAETGAVGLLSFALLFGAICLEAIRARLSSVTLAGPLTGVLAGLVALCVFGLGHNMIGSEIWFVAGIVMAYTKLLKNGNHAFLSST